MFEPFPGNYVWNLGVNLALVCGGNHGEIDEACRPLKEVAAKKNDPAAQMAWFESWMKLAERVERLGLIDEQANHPLSAGRKLMRAGIYYLMAERMPRNVPTALTLSTSMNSSSGVSSMDVNRRMPALFTSTLSGPSSWATPITRAQSSSEETSVCW